MRILRSMTVGLAVVVATTTVTAGEAFASADTACSKTVDGATYACITTKDHNVPSGDPVTFTGTLSPTAMKNLKAWTKGDNIVCLDRFKAKPEADGSWPWQTLEGACTTVNKNGTWRIVADFGRKGTYYYGLEMGPCRADKAMCGDGDPGLVGIMVGKNAKTVKVTTS